jgi:hypothetical protein
MLDSRSTPRRRTARWMFSSPNFAQNPTPLVFAPEIGAQKMGRDLQATDTLADELPGALEQSVRNALSVKTTVEDELEQLHLVAEIPSDGHTAFLTTALARRIISDGLSTANRSLRTSRGISRRKGSPLPGLESKRALVQ